MKTTFAITLGFIAAASANPLYYAARANTPGCGKPHNSGFNGDPDNHSITSGGRTRNYAVRVPDGYNDDPNKPRKVIFDFHGRGGSPKGQYDVSRYDTYDAGKEYLGIYPAGVNNSWQGAPYAIEGVNDLLFVKDLLAHVREQYCVDDNHIYASGMSNGGGFTNLLACSDEGDEFAAFAMSSAALYTDNSQDSCTKKRAIIEAHGGVDETIPYIGGRTDAGGDAPNLADWVDWWGARNGFGEDVKKLYPHDSYETTTYAVAGSGRNTVKHYKIFELGHCWPKKGGKCGYNTLDFTSSVLVFFGRWDLASAPEN